MGPHALMRWHRSGKPFPPRTAPQIDVGRLGTNHAPAPLALSLPEIPATSLLPPRLTTVPPRPTARTEEHDAHRTSQARRIRPILRPLHLPDPRQRHRRNPRHPAA